MSPIVHFLALGCETFFEVRPFILQHAWRSAFDVFGDCGPLLPNGPYEQPEQEVLSGAEILCFNGGVEVLSPSLSDCPLTPILVSKHHTQQKLRNYLPVALPFFFHDFPDQLVLLLSKFSPFVWA